MCYASCVNGGPLGPQIPKTPWICQNAKKKQHCQHPAKGKAGKVLSRRETHTECGCGIKDSWAIAENRDFKKWKFSFFPLNKTACWRVLAKSQSLYGDYKNSSTMHVVDRKKNWIYFFSKSLFLGIAHGCAAVILLYLSPSVLHLCLKHISDKSAAARVPGLIATLCANCLGMTVSWTPDVRLTSLQLSIQCRSESKSSAITQYFCSATVKRWRDVPSPADPPPTTDGYDCLWCRVLKGAGSQSVVSASPSSCGLMSARLFIG